MEENIIKDVRNLFRLNKLENETNDAAIKGMRNLFRLKKENIKNLFEHEEKDYYKPVRVGNFWSNNYIEYKSKGDRKKMMNRDNKSANWNDKLDLEFYAKDENDEEGLMQSKSDNIETMKHMKLLKNFLIHLLKNIKSD